MTRDPHRDGRQAGISLRVPGPDELPGRLGGLLRVVYLVFTQGHMAASGPSLVRGELCDQAIRLARALRRLLLGRDAEAVDSYRVALRLQPPSPERSFIDRRIRALSLQPVPALEDDVQRDPHDDHDAD